jgi:hypothetical protein
MGTTACPGGLGFTRSAVDVPSAAREARRGSLAGILRVRCATDRQRVLLLQIRNSWLTSSAVPAHIPQTGERADRA